MRRNRPLFFVDIAVPRNVDPEVTRLDGVYLYDIDDLETVVEASVQERRKEIPKVEAIVDKHLETFMAWFRSLGVAPTIVALREQTERVREAELERALRRLGNLSDKEREIIQAMTRRVVNKILHQPIVQLKKHASTRDGYQYTEVVRDLFDLDSRGG
jgi:glutamyl-tRNA reductase